MPRQMYLILSGSTLSYPQAPELTVPPPSTGGLGGKWSRPGKVDHGQFPVGGQHSSPRYWWKPSGRVIARSRCLRLRHHTISFKLYRIWLIDTVGNALNRGTRRISWIEISRITIAFDWVAPRSGLERLPFSAISIGRSPSPAQTS